MGHQIGAVLLKGEYDRIIGKQFDVKAISVSQNITIICLSDDYCDHWAAKLRIFGFVTKNPMLNATVVHHIVNAIADSPLFAVIQTDYTGGYGSQSAVVYQDKEEIMAPEITPIVRVSESVGPINKALRCLGVKAEEPKDEFDTIGLGNYRDFDDLFESYRD